MYTPVSPIIDKTNIDKILCSDDPLYELNISQFISKSNFNKLFINDKIADVKSVIFRVKYDLDVLKSLPNLTTLTFVECDMETIPEIPSLCILSFDNCYKLKYIPTLPKLKELHCCKCIKLVSIPEISTLTTLTCNSCSNIKYIPQLCNLQTLNCKWNDSIYCISRLPQLSKLCVNQCYNLEKLELLPKLKVLECLCCVSLTNISNKFPKLREIDCTNCIRLKNISNLPKLLKLDCNGCTELKILSGLFKLEKLNCTGCSSLKILPVLPNIQSLDFDHNGMIDDISIPIQFKLWYTNIKTLCRSLEYNPLNINSLNDNKYITDTQKIQILSTYPEYLEYANGDEFNKLVQFMSNNDLPLPILIKPANK
jgi:hypothetical protein